MQTLPARKTIGFRFKAPEAQSVALVGSFNNWDARRNPMWKDSDGIWKILISMPEGRNEYEFWVDGHEVADPNSRDCALSPSGAKCSVMEV